MKKALLQNLSQREAQVWLMNNDSEAISFWSRAPADADFKEIVLDNVTSFGYDNQRGDIRVLDPVLYAASEVTEIENARKIGQSKRHSVIESVVNVLVGYWIAVLAQALIFPLFGVHVPFASNMAIGGIFTVISLVRSYCLRRAFNQWHLKDK